MAQMALWEENGGSLARGMALAGGALGTAGGPTDSSSSSLPGAGGGPGTIGAGPLSLVASAATAGKSSYNMFGSMF